MGHKKLRRPVNRNITKSRVVATAIRDEGVAVPTEAAILGRPDLCFKPRSTHIFKSDLFLFDCWPIFHF